MNEDFDISGGHDAGGSSDYFRTQGLMHQPPNPGMRYIYIQTVLVRKNRVAWGTQS